MPGIHNRIGMPVEYIRDRLIQEWAEFLELDECQTIWLHTITTNIKPCELARFFIEQDIAKGLSLNQISTKRGVSIRVIRRIKAESENETVSKAAR